jgi:DNA-binding CsgD family transcriptional regulator
MREAAEDPFARWIEFVGDLLLAGKPPFPVELLLTELRGTFNAHSSWNWMEPDGSYGFHVCEVTPGWPDAAAMQFWGEGALALHPLISWFGTTRDMSAMTLGRVPREMSSREGFQLIREELLPVALDQQLSIPYRVGGGHHRAFVVSKSGEDFDDADLALARWIQPLLVLLARQSTVLSNESVLSPQGFTAAAAVGLTSREVAVLELLARGMTATAIGRQLAISARTVQVHLDHVYRKLGVHDRLMAVHMARDAGLLASYRGSAVSDDVLRQYDGTPADRTFAWHPGVGARQLAGSP